MAGAWGLLMQLQCIRSDGVHGAQLGAEEDLVLDWLRQLTSYSGWLSDQQLSIRGLEWLQRSVPGFGVELVA